MYFCEGRCREGFTPDEPDTEADSTMQANFDRADLTMRSVLRSINLLGLFLIILSFQANAASAQSAVQTLGESVAKFILPVSSPRLWSVDQPTLYTVRTVVKRDGVVLDELTIHNGFRTIRGSIQTRVSF